MHYVQCETLAQVAQANKTLLPTFILGSIRLNIGAFFSMSGMITNLQTSRFKLS